MRKILLSSAALCGLALAVSPAFAQEDGGVKLDIGGYFKGYGAFVDQDETLGREVNEFDILRNTELHFSGETTLDNGLTVGIHLETEADSNDTMDVQETYMYMSGGWGRVNLGAEDGAAFLLQVAAPSADENVDGIRQQIQPINYDVATDGAIAAASFDYDQDPTGYADKITYLTPVLNGFQAGLSYTPDVSDADDALLGVREDDVLNNQEDAYEAAARYEGQFDELEFTVGAGYSYVNFEPVAAPVAGQQSDDRALWNVGLDMGYGAFGFGAIYATDDNGDTVGMDDTDTFVVGADYTTGPFKLGASYLNSETEYTGNQDTETDRYTGGVVYTYGPGMTFRGSLSYIDHEDLPGAAAVDADADATSILIGTQVLF